MWRDSSTCDQAASAVCAAGFRRQANLAISHVRGQEEPVKSTGAPWKTCYGFVPVLRGTTLNAALFVQPASTSDFGLRCTGLGARRR